MDMRTVLESFSYYLGLGFGASWFRERWQIKFDLGAIVQGDGVSEGQTDASVSQDESPFAFTLYYRSHIPLAVFPVVFVGIARPF
jgi:hypothetical protein